MSVLRSSFFGCAAVLALVFSGATASAQLLPNLPPVTVVTAPHSATAGEVVELSASLSADVDGEVADVAWSFGDGSRIAHGSGVSHRWTSAGRFAISATAYDDRGLAGNTVVRSISVTGGAEEAPTPQPPANLCSDAPAGVKCQLGGGRQTAGGQDVSKVSHKGWPRVTGVLWVLDHNGRSGTGSPFNDELLGGHGSDRLAGGRGNDILWGDMWPTGNTTGQRDTLIGGPGNDWLYASHGTNHVSGGPGNDTIWSYFAVRATIDAGPGNDRIWAKHGTGSIDCGAGRDTIHVPLSGYSLRNCEVVKHYCQFGDDGHGGCKHGRRTVAAFRSLR